MESHYKQLLEILKKWPVDATKKSRDYGYHLREILKKTPSQGNPFPGNSAENVEKLNSLVRLSENKYRNQYLVKEKFGATGLNLSDLRVTLSDEFIKEYQKKKFRLINV